MARITHQDVDHIARLARLRLPGDEVEALAGQLARILDYVEALAELDTTGVTPTSHMSARETPLRKDEPAPCLPREDALSSAPESRDGFFVVPRILEES